MPGMNGEFVPLPPLAESNFHHQAMGSSHRNHPVTPENLHRPAHEFMSDEELRLYVEKEINQVREKVKKFQRVILGNKEKVEVKDIDIRNYAKYVLLESSDIQKRELLGCLRSKIILKNKTVNLSNQ